MATDTIKVRPRLKGSSCEVKALIKHPMETGMRKDKKSGALVPAHFIQEIVCTHNGSNVMTAYWAATISTNPYIAFSFNNAKKGDKVMLKWVDNKGDSDSVEATL
jgi:sulfur-oxidizing protein SoxZ